MKIELVLAIGNVFERSSDEWCIPRQSIIECLPGKYRDASDDWHALCQYLKNVAHTLKIDLTKVINFEDLLFKLKNLDSSCREKSIELRIVVPLKRWLEKWSKNYNKDYNFVIVPPNWQDLSYRQIWNSLDERHREYITQLIQYKDRKSFFDNLDSSLTGGNFPLVKWIKNEPKWFDSNFVIYVRNVHIYDNEIIEGNKDLSAKIAKWYQRERTKLQEFLVDMGWLFISVAIMLVFVLVIISSITNNIFLLLIIFAIAASLFQCLIRKKPGKLIGSMKQRLLSIFAILIIFVSLTSTIKYFFFYHEIIEQSYNPRMTLQILLPYWVSQGDTVTVRMSLFAEEIQGNEIDVCISHPPDIQIIEKFPWRIYPDEKWYISSKVIKVKILFPPPNEQTFPKYVYLHLFAIPDLCRDEQCSCEDVEDRFTAINRDILMDVLPWKFSILSFFDRYGINFFPKYQFRKNDLMLITILFQLFVWLAVTILRQIIELLWIETNPYKQ